MDVLSYWRLTHELPLEKAFLILQDVTLKKDTKAIFAKRLKRYVSIVLKLARYDKMKLKTMQDIGGCRAILTNEKKLFKVLRELKKIKEFKLPNGRFRTKNYIKKSKSDGYRSYHIVGVFPNNDGSERKIEIQLRTQIQHYWATALEIVDLFTGQALKSNQEDAIWKIFFLNASKQFAIMEGIHLFGVMSYKDKLISYKNELSKDQEAFLSCKTTRTYCDQLDVFEKLDAFAGSLKIIDNKLDEKSNAGFVLLIIDTSKKMVDSRIFEETESEAAEKEYIKYEKDAASNKGVIVALVSTTAVGGIKEAYPNYFADSSEFAKHLKLIMWAGGEKI